MDCEAADDPLCVAVVGLVPFADPRGTLLLELLVVPARHFDKVNRRDAVEAVQVADFVFEVFDKLPLAILALEIRRRKTGEQLARFEEAMTDALPPVLHPVNFLLVEEGHKLALCKRGGVGLDGLDKLGVATLCIVAA